MVSAFPVGYNLTQCDYDQCGGHGICGSVHRCTCEPGWVPPRCVLDLRSSSDRYVVDTWHHVTTAIAAVVLAIGIWRSIVLAHHKYHQIIEAQPGAAKLFGRWLLLTLTIDSQLSCLIVTSCGVLVLMIALILGIFRGEIQHYLLHTGCALVIAGIACYIRVFAMIVVKYAARTITLVRWLDRSCIIYLITITITLIMRPLTNVQNTSITYVIMIATHIIFLLIILIGSAIFARTVVMHAIRSMDAISLSNTIAAPPKPSLMDRIAAKYTMGPTIAPLPNAAPSVVAGAVSSSKGQPAFVAVASSPVHAVTIDGHTNGNGDDGKGDMNDTHPANGTTNNGDSTPTAVTARTGNAVAGVPMSSPLSGMTTSLAMSSPQTPTTPSAAAAAGIRLVVNTNSLTPIHATLVPSSRAGNNNNNAICAAGEAVNNGPAVANHVNGANDVTTFPTSTPHTALSRATSASDLIGLTTTTAMTGTAAAPTTAALTAAAPPNMTPKWATQRTQNNTTTTDGTTPMSMPILSSSPINVSNIPVGGHTHNQSSQHQPVVTNTQRRTAKLRNVLHTIRLLEAVGATAILVLGISIAVLGGTGLAFIMYIWTVNFYIPLIGSSLLIYVMGKTPRTSSFHSSKIGGGAAGGHGVPVSVNGTRSTPQVAPTAGAPTTPMAHQQQHTLQLPVPSPH